MAKVMTQNLARRQSHMRVSFCRRPSEMFARKNIFHTLRVQDPQVYNRRVWEEVEQEVEQNEKGDGGTVPLSSAIVRFGTRLEVAIHHGMRLLAICDVWIVPFVASFDYVYPLRDLLVLTVLDCILTCLFACGVALRFRTSYVNQHGEEGKKVSDIVKTTYKSMTFWADVAALVTAPLLHVRGPLGVMCLLRLLKTWRIPQAVYRMVLLSSPDTTTLRLLCDVLLGFFMIEHVYACAWFCAKMYSPVGFGREWSAWNGWTDKNELEFAAEGMAIPEIVSLGQLLQFYLFALRDGGYMLAGWNGVSTQSVPELVLICILAPVSSCLVAFVSGLFVSAVGAALIKQEQYLIKSASLNAACQDLHLPDELRSRICKYQSYVHIHNMDHEARDLFEHLSDNLVGEVRVHRLRKVIEESTFFQEMTAYQILSTLGMMTEKVYAPGDFICRKDDPAEAMYIIARGSVGITFEADEPCFRYMYKGEIVGIAALLRGDAVRTAFVRAETFTVLMALPRAAFQAYLDEDPDLKAKVKKSIEKDTIRYAQKSSSRFTMNAATASIFCSQASRPQGGTSNSSSADEDSDGSPLPGIKEADEAAEAADDDDESTPLMSARRTPPSNKGADASSIARKLEDLESNMFGGRVSDVSSRASALEDLEYEMFGARISDGESARSSQKIMQDRVRAALNELADPPRKTELQQLDNKISPNTGELQELDNKISPSTAVVQEVMVPAKSLSPRSQMLQGREGHQEFKSPGKKDQQESKSQSTRDCEESTLPTVYEQEGAASKSMSPRSQMPHSQGREGHQEFKTPEKSDRQESKSHSTSDHQEITLQTVYEQLLEVRGESRLCREAFEEIKSAQEKITAREESRERQLEEIRHAQEKIISMLQRVDSLQGSGLAGGTDALNNS